MNNKSITLTDILLRFGKIRIKILKIRVCNYYVIIRAKRYLNEYF